MYVKCRSIFAQTSSEILGCLRKIPALASKSHTVLFSISPAPSWPDSSLAEVVTSLSSLPHSLGCLSAPVKLQPQKRVISAAEGNIEEYALCSVAIFDSRVATPFISTIPGREAPQVGRWHAFRKGGNAKLQDHQVPQSKINVDWESIWAQKEGQHDLPEELQHLRTDDIAKVLYISDKAPEGLYNALARFTKATKLGILAHSTPFLTGHPQTLFYNKAIISSGAVGLCLHRNPQSPASVTFDFPDLHPITPMLRVSDSEGNLIHSIDDQNPSRLLLDAIAKLDSTAKDDTYYVGVYPPTSFSACSTPAQLYNIMSGDPSRGTIALEGDSSPTEGERVQIFRRPAGIRSMVAPRRGLNLCTAYPDGLDVLLPQDTSFNGVLELDGAFITVSENGLVIGRPGQDSSRSAATWKSTLPGGSCNLYWP
ncbi:hypothetical protein BDY19DRAFT_494858 [Irpex rosettiformis]|uniref:Uncharacterized protein n=1 Tax=Irpex rosettiformis TaxID=378272 RepID=A0ACB8UED8_9APHY|nr:hypothetical protein BDY19DRAFT_494858 [Irpex rosettiformis]